MIGFCSLASGSKGNCIYVGTKETRLLIDAGISPTTIYKRLAEINVEPETIDALLLSHEHIDHMRSMVALSQKWNIPILANSDTAKALIQTTEATLKLKVFTTMEPFTFGDIEILPLPIPHDAVDPVAFIVQVAGYKLAICTDLGFVTSQVVKDLQKCDYLYIEANHEPSMVQACNRPDIYKKRVLSPQGHLSNAQCATLIQEIAHGQLKEVILAHLSEECNAPALAYKTIQSTLNRLQLNTQLSIAPQEGLSKLLYFN